MIEPVSSSTTLADADLEALAAWPPVAHWITYLDPAQARLLDPAAVAHALDQGWQRTSANDGALLVRLALPAHQSRNGAGVQARLALTQAMATLPMRAPV